MYMVVDMMYLLNVQTWRRASIFSHFEKMPMHYIFFYFENENRKSAKFFLIFSFFFSFFFFSKH